MVGVGTRAYRDVPSLFPGQALLVHEYAHKLGYGERRMRVIELNGDLLRQARQVVTNCFATTELGRLETTNDVLKRGRTQEVLLFETQIFAFRDVVVRIENARDIFGVVAITNSLNIRNTHFLIKCLLIRLFIRIYLPECNHRR